MINKNKKATWYRSVPKASLLLVIVSVANFLVMLVRGYLAEIEMSRSGFFISEWTPYRAESFWLVVAAICLISNRFWILLVSIVTSGWVLWVLSYVRWSWLARNAYELPVLSWLTTEKILRDYRDRPEIIFELILASAILTCSFVLLFRMRIKWSAGS